MYKRFITLLLGCFFYFNVSATSFNEGLKAFNTQDYQAAYNIWLKIAQGKIDGSVSSSFEWKRSNKEQIKDAQYGISLLYWQGKGMEQDYQKAMYWLTQSAISGHKDAALKLGFLHLQGLAGEKNPDKARKWFLQAAKKGLVDAQYNLGILWLQGVGGEKNLKEARYWLQKATNQGDLEAQKQLASLSKNELKSKPALISVAQTKKQAEPIRKVKAITAPTPSKPKAIEQSQQTGMEAFISALKPREKSKYIIKVAALGNWDNVLRIVKNNPSSKWRFYTKKIKGKDIYVLLHCCFATKTEGSAYLRQLPSSLKKMKPYVAFGQP